MCVCVSSKLFPFPSLSLYLSPSLSPSPQDVETGMLLDLERLQAILKDLSTEISHPAILPETTREMLEVRIYSTAASTLSLITLFTSLPRVHEHAAHIQYTITWFTYRSTKNEC